MKKSKASKPAEQANLENAERIAWIKKRIGFEHWFAERLRCNETYSEDVRNRMISGTESEIARLQSDLERRKMAQL